MGLKKNGLIKTLLGLLIIPALLLACTLPATNQVDCSIDSGGYGDTAGYSDLGGYGGGYGDSGAYDDDFG